MMHSSNVLNCWTATAIATLLIVVTYGESAFTTYTTASSWQSAMENNYSTITFTELPNSTSVTNQYAPLGVNFVLGLYLIHYHNIYQSDGAGLRTAGLSTSAIVIDFSTTSHGIAVDFPDSIRFWLYSRGQLLFDSLTFLNSNSPFAGVHSTVPFDRVILSGAFSGTNIDNFYFGPPIPAPGALGLIALTALTPRRTRRA